MATEQSVTWDMETDFLQACNCEVNCLCVLCRFHFSFGLEPPDLVTAEECRLSVGELTFSWPGKIGLVSKVRYGN